MRLRGLQIVIPDPVQLQIRSGMVDRLYLDSYAPIELFVEHFRRAKADCTFNKLLISLEPQETLEASRLTMAGSAVIPWRMPPNEYCDLQDALRVPLVSEIVRDALLWGAGLFRLDPSLINDSYEHARSSMFIYGGYYRKTWLHPGGKMRGSIYYRMDCNRSELFLVLKSRAGKELGRKLISWAAPMSEMTYYRIGAGRGRWISEWEFQLCHNWTDDKGPIVAIDDILATLPE